MKPILRWMGIVVAVLLAIYFVLFATRTLQQYDLRALLAPRLLVATGLAALLYSLIIPLSGWAWSRLLRDVGVRWRPSHLAAIMGFTQLAKYIPGNVGQHVGRTTLALTKGMPAGAYLVTVVAETVLAVGSGIAVGLACAALSPVPASALPFQHRAVLGAIALLAALTPILLAVTLPWLLRRIAFIRSRLGSDPKLPGARTAAMAFVAYSANYLLIGIGLWLIAQAIGTGAGADYFYLTAAFALSWLVGFLTPGAPAGLGTREGAMALLLSGSSQGDAVLVMIAAMRVATLMGDGLCFAVSALYLRNGKPGVSDGAQA